MAPLHTQEIHPRAAFNRLHFVLYTAAILALFRRHATATSSAATLLLVLSDLVLAIIWFLSQSLRWRPIRRREFPDRLPQAVRGELPPLDVFVCTADPYKEPPASVASTALSALAFDYPAERLSVYVSDDGGSELTLFAFMEAAKFARYWLPFCRENGVMERSPEAHFESGNDEGAEEIKMMYETLKDKVESAVEKGYVEPSLIKSHEQEIFKKWKNFTRQDHPSVIQVLLESSMDRDITGHPLPNLVYVSREKHPSSPNNFKAGALNALVRVSEIMTNAPIILTLDCDMHSNDPNSPQRALCYLLDPELAPSLSYVQFPQKFRGLNANDIYGGEFRWVFLVNSKGLDGLRGPDYIGTGCFFSRRSLHGPPPAEAASSDESKTCGPLRSESVLQRADEAASCRHEDSQMWGSQIGFRYGSLVEDFNTGYRLHCQGWRSVFCNPERPAFLGDAPKNLSDGLSQTERWVVGLFQICFSRYNPLFFGSRRASLLVGCAYMHYALWGSWCIPLTIYGLLPPLALFYGIPLFPKALLVMKEELQGEMVAVGSGRLSSTTPPWVLFHPFRGEPPEPTGVRTPPLRLPGSIPFRWEEVPGKPREEPGTFRPGPNSCPSSPLQLPPRLVAAVMEKATSAIDSPRRSPDFKDQISSYISGCHAFPKLMNRSSRDRGGRRIKNYKERMFWLFLGRKKGKVDIVLGKLEEICPSASSSSSSELQTSPSSDKVHHEAENREAEKKNKAKVTRFNRSRSLGVGQCTQYSSSRFWASIYGSLKKVVP